MSNDVYTKISERMKHENFTEQEIKTVEKAKEQLSAYTTGGTVFGGATGLLLAKAKNFKGIQAMAIATGGLLIGSQLGLVMGAMSSIRTIQSIPNFQRVINIVQEIREERPGPGGPGGQGGALQHDRAAGLPSAGHARFPVQNRSELMSDVAVGQQTGFQGFKNGDGYHGGHDPDGSSRQGQDDGSTSAWAQAEQRAKEIHNNSPGWSQIRQQSMPKSAWNGIREGKSTRDDSKEDQEGDSHDGVTRARSVKTSRSSWDRVRQSDELGFGGPVAAADGPSEFPRTREDLESRPSRQKNQYGDSL